MLSSARAASTLPQGRAFVLGLATRLAALGLLAMTLVVQLTVPDGWPVHVTWAAMALGIMAWGPGRISLDHWIERLKGLAL